jgi:hypothetical protein
MEINLIYSKIQLEDAVNFISKNNPNFLGEKEYIRNKIISSMESLAKEENVSYVASMGFLLISDFNYESMDNDENSCRIEIFVDPSLGYDFLESDYVSYKLYKKIKF